MRDLIEVQKRDGDNVVSARDLHVFLEIRTEFSHWILRMLEYGFIEGQDFSSFLSKSTGGRPKTDYFLTLDCAKEISMLQRSEKGKEARQYFIQIEKRHNSLTEALRNDPIIALRVDQINMQNQINEIASAQRVLEAKTTLRPDYYTIAGYGTLIGCRTPVKLAARLGKAASAICRQKNLPTEKVNDPRFGYVNSYPSEVLKEVFDTVEV